MVARRQYAQALQKIRSALKMSPDNPNIEFSYLSILLLSKDFQAVLQETDRLIASGKKQWWIYYSSGMAKALSGDKPAGLADLDKAIAIGDAEKDAAAASHVLQEMASQISFDDALTRAESRAKEDPAWRLFVLDLYRRKGDWANAVKMAESLSHDLATLPLQQKITVEETLSMGYQSLNQPEKARQAFVAWLDLVPTDRVALNNMAYLLAETLHKPADAKTYSQRALSLAQQSGGEINSIRDTHGWVLTLCGGRDAVTGLDLLRQAVNENQNFLEARYHLGKAYLLAAKPDPDDAEEQFKAANALAKAIEANHGQVNADIKAGIQQGLDAVKQLRSAKSDASDH